MKFFHLSVRLTSEKLGAFVCPFGKPIKSLYFLSVLFVRFHFKVIRKSLYQNVTYHSFTDLDVSDGCHSKMSIFVSFLESVSEEKTQ